MLVCNVMLCMYCNLFMYVCICMYVCDICMYVCSLNSSAVMVLCPFLGHVFSTDLPGLVGPSRRFLHLVGPCRRPPMSSAHRWFGGPDLVGPSRPPIGGGVADLFWVARGSPAHLVGPSCGPTLKLFRVILLRCNGGMYVYMSVYECMVGSMYVCRCLCMSVRWAVCMYA